MTRRTIWIGLSAVAAVILSLLLIVILALPEPRERKIALTAPTGSSEWIVGSKQTISWAAEGISGVRVDLSRDGGATWEEIVASAPVAAGSHTWTVTGPHSAECVVRVSDASDGSLSARSRAPLTIAQRIRIVAPKGGEAWPAGSRQRISWASEGVKDVRLEISRDGGGNWEVIVASVPAAIGSCSWKVKGRASAACLVRVSDAADGSPAAQCDGPFAIKRQLRITSPAKDARWPVGTTRTIAWSSVGVATVRIELSRDGGGTWEGIAASVQAVQGSYSWKVGGGGRAARVPCLIRVSDTGHPEASDESTVVLASWGGAWRVDRDARRGGDGLTWQTAFRHPQDAMDVASAGDEIWVAEGKYAPRNDDDQVLLALKEGVAVYGGFAGSETARGASDWIKHKAILDGKEAVRHVVTGASKAVLDGFVVTKGGLSRGPRGGGMYNLNVPGLVVRNCLFVSNNQGGMCNRRSSPTVEHCIFARNSAENGAGMYNYEDSSPVITKCRFIENSASYGGGLKNVLRSSPTVSCCVFIANTARGFSGAMDNWRDCSARVVNCTFARNTARTGGAVHNDASSPTFTNCTFYANSADSAGGMHNTNGASPVITNCILGDIGLPGAPEIVNERAASATVKYSCVRGGWKGEGNIHADPSFVDPVIIDLHLKKGSPCIDAGTAAGAPKQDLDGNTRPSGKGVDIGAYEFVSAPGGKAP